MQSDWEVRNLVLGLTSPVVIFFNFFGHYNNVALQAKDIFDMWELTVHCIYVEY